MKREEKRIEAEGLEGKSEWERHHPLNHRYVPFSTQPKREKEST